MPQPKATPTSERADAPEEVPELESRINELEDLWRRALADLDNLRKRYHRELAREREAERRRAAMEMLPVVDNLERAVEHARGGGNGQPLVDGVSLVLKGLMDVLERHGVTRVEARGAQFDPAHHEAMAHVESAAHAPNAVVDEHQAGYRLNDRLLRPALVSVAKARDTKVAKDRDRG